MEQRNEFHATTIVAVRHDGRTAIAGDGQVTFGQNAVMKANARKVRRLYHGSVLAGYDIRHGCIGPGTANSHGYERTHTDGLRNTYLLAMAYISC